MSIISVKYELNCRKKKAELTLACSFTTTVIFLSDQPRDRLGDAVDLEIGSIELWLEGYGHPIHAK